MQISLQQVRDIAELVVQGKGTDYIDPNALGARPTYFYDGEPGCLVGGILHHLGLTPKDLIKSDGVLNLNGSRVSVLYGWRVLESDDLTRQFLDTLQDYNDECVNWGAALEEANRRTSFSSEVIVQEETELVPA